MPPAVHNIAITRGDRWTRVFRLALTPTPTVPGDYLNIATGYTGRAHIRADPDSPIIQATGTLVFGSDATSSFVRVTFSESDTVGLDSDAKWDLELTHTTNGPYTWIGGAVVVTKDISVSDVTTVVVENTGAIITAVVDPPPVAAVIIEVPGDVEVVTVEADGIPGGGGGGSGQTYVEDPEDPGTYVSAAYYMGTTDPAVGGGAPYVWLDPNELGGADLPLLAADDPTELALSTTGLVTTATILPTIARVADVPPRPLFSTRTTDTTGSTDATTLLDTGLSVAVAAGKTYAVEAYLPYAATVTADVRFQFVATTVTVAGTWSGFGLRVGATSTDGTFQPGVNAWTASQTFGGIGADNTSPSATIVRGKLVTTGVAGTLKIQYRQNTLDASNPTLVKAHAYLMLTEVA